MIKIKNDILNGKFDEIEQLTKEAVALLKEIRK